MTFKWKNIDLAAWGLLIFAILVRLVLLVNGWPETNSEEGTMGLAALHIASGSDHPIYFYGQHYMGVGEAYVAAVFYHLLGASVFSLRLAMLLLFSLFLILLYL